MDLSWNNLSYNTFLFKKLNGLLTDEATAVVAVGQLKTLAQQFADKSALEEGGKEEHLLEQDEDALEEQWFSLLNIVIRNKFARSVQSSPRCIAQLKVTFLGFFSLQWCL